MGMANPPVFALLNQTRADSGILVRVTPSEFWYKSRRLLAARRSPVSRRSATRVYIPGVLCRVGIQDVLWRQLDERIGISRELTETSSSKFSGASATRADPV
jgi:hypothetical protein